MIQEKREKREKRVERDWQESDNQRQWTPPPEVKYTFAVNGRVKPPEVYGDHFQRGGIVGTSEGPHRIIEVYWWTATKARVLLRPLTADELAEKPQKSHATARKPARKRTPRRK